VETSCLNIDLCTSESSQDEISRTWSADFSKARSKPRSFSILSCC